MSSTQKKPDNTKRAASGKASGKPAKRATAKSSSAKKGTSARKKPAAYTPDLASRGIAAAVCIFLALLVALGMFGIHAVVPDLLKKGIQGLIGYGFWMVAFVLLWAAGLLLFAIRSNRSWKFIGIVVGVFACGAWGCCRWWGVPCCTSCFGRAPIPLTFISWAGSGPTGSRAWAGVWSPAFWRW